MLPIIGIDPSLRSTGVTILDEKGQCICLAQIEDPTDRKISREEKFLAIRETIARLLKKYGITQVASERARFGINEPVLYGLMWVIRTELLLKKIRFVYFDPSQWYSYAYSIVDIEKLGRKREFAKLTLQQQQELQAKQKVWENKGKTETRKLVAEELGMDFKKVGSDAADSYFMAKLGQRFWAYIDKDVSYDQLTEAEKRVFYWTKTYKKGPRVGTTEEGGIAFEKGISWFPIDHVTTVNLRLTGKIELEI